MPKPGDDVSLSEYRALAEFRYQIRRFLHFSEQAARAAGVEPHQHQLLLALHGLPGGVSPTIRHLAERLQIRHHSAVELINRLEQHGLVARRRGEQDRREVLLGLTARGGRVLRDLSLPHRAELRSTGPALVQALESLLTAGRASAPGRRRAAAGPCSGVPAAMPSQEAKTVGAGQTRAPSVFTRRLARAGGAKQTRTRGASALQRVRADAAGQAPAAIILGRQRARATGPGQTQVRSAFGLQRVRAGGVRQTGMPGTSARPRAKAARAGPQGQP